MEEIKTIEEAKIKWKERPVGKAQDFTGQKINHWTIYYRAEDSRRPMWVAQCDCGNFKKIRAGNWSQSCTECQHKNQQKDYTGLRFNMLTCTSERKSKNGKTYIKCICDCGKSTWVSGGNLTSGEVKSCGCLSHQCNRELEDLTNQIFSDLTVLRFIRTKNGQRYWECQCKCGNIKEVTTGDLKSGSIKSCGCRKYLNIKPGDKFGKLIVIKKVENKVSSSGGYLWYCNCDCGTKNHIVVGNRLIDGSIKSCGCGRRLSYKEEAIATLLTNNNIPFNREYNIQELNTQYPTGGRPREFDFYVDNQYIIEFDGSQHFKYTGTGWDTKDHFERTRKSDLIKNKYCFEHNIPLIRIPYNADYNINDLKLETTRFLLTPENEQKYYNDIK